MTIVGYIVPYYLAILMDLMKWDFAAELLYDDLRKNYYTSMFNIIIFGSLQYIDVLQYGEKTTVYMEDGIGVDTEVNCKEDVLTDNLLKLLIFEIVSRYLYYGYWLFHWYVKSKIYGEKKSPFKQEFELADEIGWYFTIEVILWINQLMYPIVAWLAVIFMYLHTKYLIYRLKYQKK